VEDMGGLVNCHHWIEELKKPLMIKQGDISRDVCRFMNSFPQDAIPFKSNNEKKIEIYQK